MHRRMGNVVVELYWRHAPKTCKNFAELARRGYYNNTKFHRIIKDFMVQGGDPTGTGVFIGYSSTISRWLVYVCRVYLVLGQPEDAFHGKKGVIYCLWVEKCGEYISVDLMLDHWHLNMCYTAKFDTRKYIFLLD